MQLTAVAYLLVVLDSTSKGIRLQIRNDAPEYDMESLYTDESQQELADDEQITDQFLFPGLADHLWYLAKQTSTEVQSPEIWAQQIMNGNRYIRLRGDRRNGQPNQGRVEVFINGVWGVVCDDNWNLDSASVACRMLGYKRGASRESSKSEFGYRGLLHTQFLMDDVHCNGNETSLLQCSYSSTHDCGYHETAGVVCILDSVCPYRGTAWKDSCYQYVEKPQDYEGAQLTCQKIRGQLAMHSTTDHAMFLGELLLSLENAPSIVLVHGPQVSSSGRTSAGDFKFENDPDCVALAKNSGGATRSLNTVTYQLRSVKCNRDLPFICVTDSRPQDCFHGNGVRYTGTASHTLIGTRCNNWSLKRDLLHLESDSTLLPEKAVLNHNLCRNPDGDRRPWCWVNAAQRIFGYCNIPRCSFVGDPHVNEEVNLQRSTFICALTNYWLPSNARCNGHVDCPHGEDEQNCHTVLLTDFVRARNSRLGHGAADIYRAIALERCSSLCHQAKFNCKAFVYQKSARVCFLYRYTNSSQDVSFDSDYDTYFSRAMQSNCSGMFSCQNTKCIQHSVRCNGVDDCGDYSDESSCERLEDDFEIQLRPLLMQHGREHAGLVTFKLKKHWHYICDDNWDFADARVVCRQLGYSDAFRALKLLTANTNHMITEVHCNGSEDSLESCLSPGAYSKTICSNYEGAGVICKVDVECRADMFACFFNKKCLSPRLVCDGFDDCGDNHDEKDCEKIQIGLVDGPSHHSGRVEITRNGFRGSLCGMDIDKTAERVICRSLGFSGNSTGSTTSVRLDSYGPIWLDTLKCTGNERNILECQYPPWGDHQCDYDNIVWIDCNPDIGNVDPSLSNRSQVRAVVMTFPESISNAQRRISAGIIELWTAEMCTLSFWRNSTNDNVLRNIFQSRYRRITGGQNATLLDFPMLVSIHINDLHKCGGVLLNDRWILSAAHCFSLNNRRKYSVVIGTDTIKKMEPTARRYRVERVITHYKFLPYSNNDYDFALVKVLPTNGQYITFTERTKPACLPKSEKDSLPARLRCYIVGWGNKQGGKSVNRMKKGTVVLFDDQTCTTIYKNETTPRMMCAGWTEGVIDTCNGDSGGPLICPMDGIPIVVGITSFGRGCGEPNSPGVYSRITSVLPWIYSHVSPHDQPTTTKCTTE